MSCQNGSRILLQTKQPVFAEKRITMKLFAMNKDHPGIKAERNPLPGQEGMIKETRVPNPGLL